MEMHSLTDHKLKLSKGLFISFEGSDGVGKSTQINALYEWLLNKGYGVIKTREPGGSHEAEAIRTLLLHDNDMNWDAVSETLLIYAARRHHVETVIKPALMAGKIVLCDRFHDSTLAYQGGGRGLDAEWIMRIHLASLGDFFPDLTFLLRVDAKTRHQRLDNRANDQASDRLESETAEFKARVEDFFDNLAALSPTRIIPLDGTRLEDEIHDDIRHITENWLNAVMES